jgi:hypothetical protein
MAVTSRRDGEQRAGGGHEGRELGHGACFASPDVLPGAFAFVRRRHLAS